MQCKIKNKFNYSKVGYFPDTTTNQCKICDPNCKSCIGPSNNCTNCIDGRWLNGNRCDNCDSSCKTCSGAGSNKCI